MQKEVMRKLLLKASNSPNDIAVKQAILEHLRRSGPEVHAKFFRQLHKNTDPDVYHNSLKSPHQEGIFAEHPQKGFHYTADNFNPVRVPSSRMQAAQFIASHPNNPDLIVSPHPDYIVAPAKHVAYGGKTYGVPAKLRGTGQPLGIKFNSPEYWENFVNPIFNPKSRITVQHLKDAADVSIPELKDSWDDLPVISSQKPGVAFRETLKNAPKTAIESIQHSEQPSIQRIKPIISSSYEEYKQKNVPAWEEYLNRGKLPLMLSPEMMGFQKPEYMGNWFDTFMRSVLQSKNPLPEGIEGQTKGKVLQTLVSGLKGELGNAKVFYDHLRKHANEMLEHGNIELRRKFGKEYGKYGGTNKFYNLPRLTAKINMLERMSNPEFHPHNELHPDQQKVHSMLDRIAAKKVGKGSFSELGAFLSNQSHYDKYMGTRKAENIPKTSLDITPSAESSSPISQSIIDNMSGIDSRDIGSYSDALKIVANSKTGKIPINLKELVDEGHIKSKIPKFVRPLLKNGKFVLPDDLAKAVGDVYRLSSEDQTYNKVIEDSFEKEASPFLEELLGSIARKSGVPEDYLTNYSTGAGEVLGDLNPQELSDMENLGHHFLASGNGRSIGLDFAPHILDGTLTSGDGRYRKHYAFSDADKNSILSAMHGYNYLKQKHSIKNKNHASSILSTEMSPEEWDNSIRGRQLVGMYLHRLLQAGSNKSIGGTRGFPDLPPEFMKRMLTSSTGQQYLGKYDRLSTPFGAGTRDPINKFGSRQSDNIAQTLVSLGLNHGKSFSELSNLIGNKLSGNTYGTSHNKQNWKPTWNGISAFLKDYGITDPTTRAMAMRSLMSGKAYNPEGIDQPPNIKLDKVRKEMIRDEVSPLIFKGEYVEDVHDLLNMLDDAKDVKDIWHILNRLPQSGKLVRALS